MSQYQLKIAVNQTWLSVSAISQIKEICEKNLYSLRWGCREIDSSKQGQV